MKNETPEAQALRVVRTMGSPASAKEALQAALTAVFLLERRVVVLEQQQKAMRYRGVWQPAEAYERGNLATYDGSLWIAIDEAPGRPGERGWQLAAKKGRDAR